MTEAVRAAAATILYRPDPVLLDGVLRAVEAARWRLFVYVNGPVDGAVERLLADLVDARILRMPVNVGQGEGLNAVMAAAAGEGFAAVLLLDQDSAPSPTLPAALHDRFVALAATGWRLAAVGPRLTPPAGEGYRPLRYARWRSPVPGAVAFLPTSGSLVSIAAWQAIGPFRADYFVDGIDVEWGLRGWQLGYGSALAEDLVMPHRWGIAGASAREPQMLRLPPPRLYLYVRNTLATLRLTHVPWSWRLTAGARLGAQLGLVLGSRRAGLRRVSLIHRAIADGWHGRLGPPPSDLVAG